MGPAGRGTGDGANPSYRARAVARQRGLRALFARLAHVDYESDFSPQRRRGRKGTQRMRFSANLCVSAVSKVLVLIPKFQALLLVVGLLAAGLAPLAAHAQAAAFVVDQQTVTP